MSRPLTSIVEIGVLKDAAGLGLLIFLIASTQLFSALVGA